MNPAIIKRFDACRDKLLDTFTKNPPNRYEDVVKTLVAVLSDGDLNMDPERITKIDHGHYQGTLLFVIAAKGYQPRTFWVTTCSYGSCSHCDTMEGIQYDDGSPADKAKDYLTLALHLAQAMKEI